MLMTLLVTEPHAAVSFAAAENATDAGKTSRGDDKRTIKTSAHTGCATVKQCNV